MKNTRKKTFDTYKLTLIAIMTAVVVVLQTFIRIPIANLSIAITLVPIVVGAVICGPLCGLWLGAVTGFIILMSGEAATFLAFSIPGTIITVMLKGMLCGFVPGLTFKLLKNANKYLAVVISSVLCPIVNTLVFILGVVVFFLHDITVWASSEGVSAFVFIIFGLVGINFLIEFTINLVFCPIIYRIINLTPLKNRNTQ